ncbi:MAG: efflux RND transporter periplasmic adaptor subunit, partial [Patescibacteria group bacterium]|nr:efflux RND transporter periplasmic adaptor subunit [Patescibacteria group bacterium]
DGKVRANNTLSTTKTSRDQQLTSAADRVEAAKKALRIAVAQLNKVKAAARVEDVNLIRAQIRQAQASVALVKNQIDHNKIEAPLDGIVTEVNYKLGEQTSASKTAIKMMAQDGYEIELDISETDIAKLKIGDTAKITFDAFGDNVKLDGRVASIDPAQTIIQGVIYYQTKIDFMSDQTEIKPGMTATADIETAKKDNALVIPYRAVQEKDGRKIIKILKNNQPEEKQVEIGLIGDGGQAEVISGISEGDDVITFTKNNEKTNTNGQN